MAAVVLVGGSSRIPLVGTLLHQRLGIAPTILDQPELVVAEGSLRAVPALPGASAPPLRFHGWPHRRCSRASTLPARLATRRAWGSGTGRFRRVALTVTGGLSAKLAALHTAPATAAGSPADLPVTDREK